MPRDTLNKTLIINYKKELNFEEGFEGQYAGMQTRIMEYSVLKQYRTPDSNNKYIKKQEYGIIFTSQMKKKFKGQTIIVSDQGIMNKFLNYKGLDRVTLESPEFEKMYEVFSDDQVEARYILTTVMLEYMVELKKLFKKIEYSFFNNEIWINISVNKNSFECSSFFRTVINKKRLEKTFKQLYLLFSIIKILRLDQDRLL